MKLRFMLTNLLLILPATLAQTTLDWVVPYNDDTELSLDVGSQVIFDYTSTTHNVYLMPDEQAFLDCNFDDATELCSVADGECTVEVTAGVSYYACQISSHCATFGQRIAITGLSVESNDTETNDTATTAPTATPTTVTIDNNETDSNDTMTAVPSTTPVNTSTPTVTVTQSPTGPPSLFGEAVAMMKDSPCVMGKMYDTLEEAEKISMMCGCPGTHGGDDGGYMIGGMHGACERDVEVSGDIMVKVVDDDTAVLMGEVSGLQANCEEGVLSIASGYSCNEVIGFDSPGLPIFSSNYSTNSDGVASIDITVDIDMISGFDDFDFINVRYLIGRAITLTGCVETLPPTMSPTVTPTTSPTLNTTMPTTSPSMNQTTNVPTPSITLPPVPGNVTMPPTVENITMPPTVENITMPPTVENITMPPTVENITMPPTVENITMPPTVENITMPPTVENITMPPTVENITMPPTVENISMPVDNETESEDESRRLLKSVSFRLLQSDDNSTVDTNSSDSEDDSDVEGFTPVLGCGVIIPYTIEQGFDQSYTDIQPLGYPDNVITFPVTKLKDTSNSSITGEAELKGSDFSYDLVFEKVVAPSTAPTMSPSMNTTTMAPSASVMNETNAPTMMNNTTEAPSMESGNESSLAPSVLPTMSPDNSTNETRRLLRSYSRLLLKSDVKSGFVSVRTGSSCDDVGELFQEQSNESSSFWEDLSFELSESSPNADGGLDITTQADAITNLSDYEGRVVVAGTNNETFACGVLEIPPIVRGFLYVYPVLSNVSSNDTSRRLDQVQTYDIIASFNGLEEGSGSINLPGIGSNNFTVVDGVAFVDAINTDQPLDEIMSASFQVVDEDGNVVSDGAVVPPTPTTSTNSPTTPSTSSPTTEGQGESDDTLALGLGLGLGLGIPFLAALCLIASRRKGGSGQGGSKDQGGMPEGSYTQTAAETAGTTNTTAQSVAGVQRS